MSDANASGNGVAWKALGALGGVLVLLGGFALSTIERRLSTVEDTCARKDAITMAPETRRALEGQQRELDLLRGDIDRMKGRP